MIAGLGIAAGVLFLGLIFVFLLYKEAQNNVVLIEKEKEEEIAKINETVKEKDNQIQTLSEKNESLNSELATQKSDFETKLLNASNNSPDLIGKTIVDNDVLKSKDDLIKQKELEVKEYKQLSINLIKDLHELEDKYIDNGGNLSDLYEDYNEYYG